MARMKNNSTTNRAQGAKTGSVVTRTKTRLTGEEIRALIEKRAYEIYRYRGNKPGDHMSDWLTAEKQVRQELRVS